MRITTTTTTITTTVLSMDVFYLSLTLWRRFKPVDKKLANFNLCLSDLLLAVEKNVSR